MNLAGVALPADAEEVSDAFTAALDSLSRLQPTDPLRAKMRNLLDLVEPQLLSPRASRGQRPSLSRVGIDRRDMLNRLKHDDPRRPLRSGAFAAIEKLLETGWPPIRSTARSKNQRAPLVRKRKRGALCVDTGTLRAEMTRVQHALDLLPRQGDRLAHQVGVALHTMDRLLCEKNTVEYGDVNCFLHSSLMRWNLLGKLPADSPRRPGAEAVFAAWDRLVALAWPTDDRRCTGHRAPPTTPPDGVPPVPPPLFPLASATVGLGLRRVRARADDREDAAAARADDRDDAAAAANEDDDAWRCQIRQEGCIKPQNDSPEPAGPYFVWLCDKCNWCACQACSACGAHALCEHPLELIDQDGEFVCRESLSPGVFLFDQ